MGSRAWIGQEYRNAKNSVTIIDRYSTQLRFPPSCTANAASVRPAITESTGTIPAPPGVKTRKRETVATTTRTVLTVARAGVRNSGRKGLGLAPRSATVSVHSSASGSVRRIHSAMAIGTMPR